MRALWEHPRVSSGSIAYTYQGQQTKGEYYMASPVQSSAGAAQAHVNFFDKTEFESDIVKFAVDTFTTKLQAELKTNEERREAFYGMIKTKRDKLVKPGPYDKKAKKLQKEIDKHEQEITKIRRETDKITKKISEFKENQQVLAQSISDTIIIAKAKSGVGASEATHLFDKNLIPKGFIRRLGRIAKIIWKIFKIIIKKLGKQLWNTTKKELKKIIKKELEEIKEVAANEIATITDRVINLLFRNGLYPSS